MTTTDVVEIISTRIQLGKLDGQLVTAEIADMALKEWKAWTDRLLAENERLRQSNPITAHITEPEGLGLVYEEEA